MSADYELFLILIVIGLLLLLFGIYFSIKSFNTKKWNEVEGVILKSALEKISTAAGYDGESQSFKADIEYRYSVGNIEYISKRVFYGDVIGKPFPFKSKSIIKKYPKDSKVIVYFNPLKPKESVLQKGLKFIIIELIIVGGLFMLFGFIIYKYESLINLFISR